MYLYCQKICLQDQSIQKISELIFKKKLHWPAASRFVVTLDLNLRVWGLRWLGPAKYLDATISEHINVSKTI